MVNSIFLTVKNIVVRNWCDCGWVKLIFFFIKISSGYKVMFLISGIGLRLADKSGFAFGLENSDSGRVGLYIPSARCQLCFRTVLPLYNVVYSFRVPLLIFEI